ncbi:non-canonical purine NTP diphosphatase [Galbibacter sp.]|uniref:non-canonical purine NTP diphosphatase n=1 Tax=Galbibacter sp. TaxID=2918471 RepID=UPI003A8FEEE8
MKLVFATHNMNKLAEIKAILPPHLEIVSLSDIGCDEPIEEWGDTIAQNAVIKAQYVWDRYHLNCFSDDTGLEVKALNNAPGVYSARYAGEDNNTQNNIAKLLHELKDKDQRTARFKTVIALIINGELTQFEGIVNGEITEEPVGGGGFGYDPVFIADGFDRTFALLSPSEKNNISHRGIAFQKLAIFLK